MSTVNCVHQCVPSQSIHFMHGIRVCEGYRKLKYYHLTQMCSLKQRGSFTKFGRQYSWRKFIININISKLLFKYRAPRTQMHCLRDYGWHLLRSGRQLLMVLTSGLQRNSSVLSHKVIYYIILSAKISKCFP